jgi:hypothetical protein
LSRLEDAARLGLIEQLRQQRRGIGFFGHDQHVDATPAGIKHVLGTFARHIDVGDQSRTRHTDAQLAHPFKVSAAIDVQIEDHDVDRPALTGAGQRCPVLTRNETVPITRRTAKARESGFVGEERRDHSHATVRSGKGKHWGSISQ